MNDLKIVYNNGNGKMTVHLDVFFPTTQKQFKKLLDVIALDIDNQTELKKQLQDYFQNRMDGLDELYIKSCNEYVKFRQNVAELTELIESLKHPNGVRASDQEIASAKKELDRFTNYSKTAHKDMTEATKRKKQFLKYLEMIEQRK